MKQSEPFASVDESDRMVEIQKRKGYQRPETDLIDENLSRKGVGAERNFFVEQFFNIWKLVLLFSLSFFVFAMLVSFRVTVHCTLSTHRSIVKFWPIEFMCR